MQKNLTMPLSMTHDLIILIDLYMFIITSMTFPVIPYENNFFHNVALFESVDRIKCLTIIYKGAEQSSQFCPGIKIIQLYV